MYCSITPLIWLVLALTLIEHATAGAVFIFTYGGKITRFEATLHVPSPPTALQGHSPDWKVQATWAGMQPTDQSCVLQNVVGNAGEELGHWSHVPSFYDGATKPSWIEVYFEEVQPEVYPGDEITSIWALDESSNKWLDTWSVIPVKIGASKGEVPYSGNYTFDGTKFGTYGGGKHHFLLRPLKSKVDVNVNIQILLMIEHVGIGGSPDPGWGSGAVMFTNILIESVSTQDWCNHENSETWHPQDVKVLDVSTPFSSAVRDGKKICRIARLVTDLDGIEVVGIDFKKLWGFVEAEK
ncbi:predicted protein [Sclerotinia sclerotiorum 1980 UF-70]|uniref:Uncharacterized protein n=2 Tax=Sclerotinia sclerotiorum (strain ATCC 18683 / 1980 / Ss-1) TaxID=665079 RepID=A7F5W7_SCLS1|nr:predicted protein [Sclerotinia sclerotiorum 1980 UF-70]APA07417.1 hypothetical protein sscle_02g021870 [Sclerotinia sclerotiorum 1980 UF-70]EDN98138.1 predicted protein [Sclerotinia sclerotiorum 1980 UF-70]